MCIYIYMCKHLMNCLDEFRIPILLGTHGNFFHPSKRNEKLTTYPLPFPALLSRWFSELPFRWDINIAMIMFHCFCKSFNWSFWTLWSVLWLRSLRLLLVLLACFELLALFPHYPYNYRDSHLVSLLSLQSLLSLSSWLSLVIIITIGTASIASAIVNSVVILVRSIILAIRIVLTIGISQHCSCRPKWPSFTRLNCV